MWPKKKPKNKIRSSENNSQQAEESEPNLVFEVPNYENWYPDDKPHEAIERRNWGRQNRTNLFTLIFSAIAAIGAIVAAAIAYNAFFQAKRQADAAVTQIENGKIAEMRQLRAYLHVLTGGLKVENLPSGELTLTITPRFKVFGQTPAGNIAIAWIPDLLPAPIGANTIFPEYLPGLYLSTLVAPPGEDQFVIPKALKIGPIGQGQLKAGSHVVVIVGTVLYLDVFKQSRFTSFCYSFTWQGIESHQGETCLVHNQTDWSGGPVEQMSVRVPMR